MGANLDDQDRMATEVWALRGSPSLTSLDTVKRDLAEEAVPLILALAPVEGGVTPPTEIQISPGGRVETESKGAFVMDYQAQMAIAVDFRAAGRDMVIDYEHQSLGEGEAPAAGWITRLIARGADGLWAVVNWTDRAAQYLKAREYRYLSPVLLVRKDDRRAIKLHSVGLTNTPEIRKLIPLVARQGGAPVHNTKEEQMKERLITLLKLSADATDEAIVGALEAISAKAKAVTAEVLAALELKADASASDAVASIHALKQTKLQAGSLEVMQAELKTLKQQAAERRRDELVQMALSTGKITQAQTEWAREYALRDAAGFEAFTAKAPVVVPVGGPMTTPQTMKADGAMDETQRMINKTLGVNAEAYKKYAEKED